MHGCPGGVHQGTRAYASQSRTSASHARSPLIQPASVREKRLIAAWKGYVAGLLNGELP
jgi:hypothetical protein